MKLAVIDASGSVLLEWPTTAEAHCDLADLFAARLHPSRFRSKKRAKVAAELRLHLLDLQAQTIRL